MISPWRIVFMGTPDFAVPSLDALLSGPDPVVGVFTQPDKPVGRGLKMAHPAIKQALLRHAARTGQEVVLLQPARLRAPEAVAALRQLEPDLVVVVAYGQLLSPDVLAIPRHGCINVHASLLPRWRGAAPIQRALLAGDTESGVTIMQMDAGLDTGPTLSRRALALSPDITGGGLHDQLAELGARLLQETLPRVKMGELKPQPQPTEGVTYAAKLTKQDGLIVWSQPAPQIRQRIMALNPWPAAHTSFRGKPLKIFGAHTAQGRGTAGQLLALRDEGLEVACAHGSLILTDIQLAGKRRMRASDWLRGQDVSAGESLGHQPSDSVFG